MKLAAPIPRTRRNVFCVGWNYSEQFAEGQVMRGRNDDPPRNPDFRALFSKQPNTVVGPEAPALHPERRHAGQWFKGKNFDTHCPLGPWIVTPDEIGDPQDLRNTVVALD